MTDIKYFIPEFDIEEVAETTIKSLTIGQQTSEITDWSKQIANIPAVWKKSRGAGVKIAILDTGITDHPDLQGAIIKTENFTSEPDVKDGNNHGTLIAGIIAARENKFGVVGIAPESELYIGKVAYSSGAFKPEELIRGLEWALKSDVDIISLSMGLPVKYKGLHKIIKKIAAAGKFIICSSGNDTFVPYPAKYPETLAIGSVDRYLLAAGGAKGNEIDFVAPGVGIASINREGKVAYVRSGTSFAAPFVAGIVALIISQKNNPIKPQSIDQLRLSLREHSIDLGPEGRDDSTGNGLISFWKNDTSSQFIRSLSINDLTPSGFKKLINYLSSKT